MRVVAERGTVRGRAVSALDHSLPAFRGEIVDDPFNAACAFIGGGD